MIKLQNDFAFLAMHLIAQDNVNDICMHHDQRNAKNAKFKNEKNHFVICWY